MGQIASLICYEGIQSSGSALSAADKMEAYLWANLTYLSEKISSPEEKQKIEHSSNGALKSLKDFQFGNAYALVGSVTDADGVQVLYFKY
jgi:hypothetical protein